MRRNGHALVPRISVDDPPENPFLKLPKEIIQYIAYLLPSDADIAHLSACCKSLTERIIPEQSTIWRMKFRDIYDLPPNRNSLELKVEYQIRAIALSYKVNFKRSEEEQQSLWLTVMRDMILESFELSGNSEDGTSKTFKRIREALTGSDFLSEPKPLAGRDPGQAPSEEVSDLFCAVQLSLTGLALDPGVSTLCLRTDYDIAAVYSYPTDTEEPGPFPLNSLDLEKMMHIRNFWLRHLLNRNEASFYTSYTDLHPSDRPSAQGSLTRNRRNLTQNWLGYYSCIHPLPETLSAFDRRQTCADLDNHLTQVDCMALVLTPDTDPLNWPPAFREFIPLLSNESNRSYFRGVQRNHNHDDSEMNMVRGFVEPIQNSQGFPVAQRVCFAIYEANRQVLPLENVGAQGSDDLGPFPEESWPPMDVESSFHCIHGYEGRLLPGNRIMIGQWVDMLNITGKGPFIFWDV